MVKINTSFFDIPKIIAIFRTTQKPNMSKTLSEKHATIGILMISLASLWLLLYIVI